MNKNITLSVIMAEYNTNISVLRRSIRSILNQTFKDFEFIIVDDGGLNDLDSIVQEFKDSRIKIIKNSTNLGLVASLNKAIESAQADYLVRMDTDDIAEPQRFKNQYDFMQNNSQWDVVGTKAIEFSEKGKGGILGNAGEKTMKSVMRGDALIHPSVIMKKTAVQAVGGYKGFKRAEDLSLWCEMLLAGYRLYVIDDILLQYRLNTSDYEKRKLKYRMGEIKARLYYYPKMHAGPIEYLVIIKSIVAGIAPTELVQKYRNKYVLKKETK